MDTRGIPKILKLDIKTKTILRFFILTILVTQALNSFGQSNATVRFDGLYQTVSEIDTASHDTSSCYLRFYPNGRVLSVTSMGTVDDLKNWFNLKQENPSVGVYEITGNRIYFTTSSKEGTVVYDGQINEKYYLDISVKSLINGHFSKERYYFVKIIGME